MAATTAHLLMALVDACRLGQVAQGEAAKLVGIRKADMGDLVAWRMAERAIWRAYVSAFNGAFPECDQRLSRVPIRCDPPTERPWPMPAECRHYSASDASFLPASQAPIFAPPSNAAREFAEPEMARAWEN